MTNTTSSRFHEGEQAIIDAPGDPYDGHVVDVTSQRGIWVDFTLEGDNVQMRRAQSKLRVIDEFVEGIISGEYQLTFLGYGPEQTVVTLFHEPSGEVREQMVGKLPGGKLWRQTVANRMLERNMEFETPLTLLKGLA